jgi:hypothetical protein
VVPVPSVDGVEIAFAERREAGASLGWIFEAYVMGSDLVEGTITPPGGPSLALIEDDEAEFGFVSDPFVSLEELQASYPATADSGYVIRLNHAVASVELDFDPLVPDGLTTISAPADEAVVGPRPAFSNASSCTTSEGLVAELDDHDTGGVLGEHAAVYGTPLPTTVAFDDFQANEGSADLSEGLPRELEYSFSTEVFTEVITFESLTPADDFDYYAAAFRTDRILFSVPEASALQLAAGALMTLVWLRNSKRGSR